MKVLNLGCGMVRKEGAINVDRSLMCNPDFVWDLNRFPYPWEDGSIDKIIASHVLEHLDDTIGVMDEFNRILKWNGILEISVPHTSHDLVLGDVYHKKIINAFTFSPGSTRSPEDLVMRRRSSLVLEKHYVNFCSQFLWLLKFPKFIKDFCSNHLRNIARESVFILRKTGKFVTLTFDDGPSEYTNQILDILKRFSVKAVFFVLGINAVKHPNIIKRIIDEGHTLGVHGFDHSKWVNKSIVEKEVLKTKEILKLIVPGYKLEYFRPPYLKGFATTFPHVLKVPSLKGMCAVDYTTICDDWIKETTAKQIISVSLVLMRGGGTILLHDGARPKVLYKERNKVCEALPYLIGELMNRNYMILGIKELEDARAGKEHRISKTS